MMFNDDSCFVCGKKGHIGHHSPKVQCYTCDGFGHFAQDCPEKSPHQEHLAMAVGHAPTHIIITAMGTNHSPSITDTGQDHTIDLNVTEAPVTTRDMHPAPYLATTAVHNIHPQTDTLEDTPTGIPYTITDTIHPQPDALHARGTLTTTPPTTVSLAQGTPLVLPMDCIQGRHQRHIYGWHPHRPQHQRKVTIEDLQLDSSSESDDDSDVLKPREPSSSSDKDLNK